jgi:ArsR family transcriptional regulator
MTYPSLEELDLLHSSVCRALADPKRIQILYALHSRARHVTALANDLGLPQPTVSRHLRILRQNSLVSSERDGPTVVYEITDSRIIDILDMMRQVMFDSIAHQSGLVNKSE